MYGVHSQSQLLSEAVQEGFDGNMGGEVIPSPSNRTEVGRKILERDPDNPGSLEIAISEAIEDAVKHDDTWKRSQPCPVTSNHCRT